MNHEVETKYLEKDVTDDKHPEKRMKAGFEKFKEEKMEELKEDYPGLGFSQYNSKLFKMWTKSKENPKNNVNQ